MCVAKKILKVSYATWADESAKKLHTNKLSKSEKRKYIKLGTKGLLIDIDYCCSLYVSQWLKYTPVAEDTVCLENKILFIWFVSNLKAFTIKSLPQTTNFYWERDVTLKYYNTDLFILFPLPKIPEVSH